MFINTETKQLIVLLIIAANSEKLFLTIGDYINPKLRKETDSVKASKLMFDECGVKYYPVEIDTSEITIKLEKN